MPSLISSLFFCLFFFNDTATTEIYTLSLHDALPISTSPPTLTTMMISTTIMPRFLSRSEEHTSELQSRENLVCRLLLEKKQNPNLREESSRRTAFQQILWYHLL